MSTDSGVHLSSIESISSFIQITITISFTVLISIIVTIAIFRVCPFIKPVGQNCVVEKKDNQCCPTISCPPGQSPIVDKRLDS